MRTAHAWGTEAERKLTEMLVFGLEQRLQCTACAVVSYRVDPHDLLSVPVLDRETGKDAEGRATYEEAPLTRCIGARFVTFPHTLVVHAKKFRLVNWVSTKLVDFKTKLYFFGKLFGKLNEIRGLVWG
ncbi:hypothetical protein EDB86DRAFT_2834001 [Lactarius hatsudake]|nr:hypothetical protein EDB86DRAFT_2834001 [Lactarius hatsudake]